MYFSPLPSQMMRCATLFKRIGAARARWFLFPFSRGPAKKKTTGRLHPSPWTPSKEKENETTVRGGTPRLDSPPHQGRRWSIAIVWRSILSFDAAAAWIEFVLGAHDRCLGVSWRSVMEEGRDSMQPLQCVSEWRRKRGALVDSLFVSCEEFLLQVGNCFSDFGPLFRLRTLGLNFASRHPFPELKKVHHLPNT